MEPETLTVIDVGVQQVDSLQSESILRWYSAGQIQSLLGLNKASLQKAIARLTSIYSIELQVLRRGSARATEYSQIALDAIELHDGGKFSELRRLVDKIPTVTSAASSSAIVLLDQHNEIALNAETTASSNLREINFLKSGLLNKYRDLGRSMGKQAVAEVRQGFTDEVKAGLANLQES